MLTVVLEHRLCGLCCDIPVCIFGCSRSTTLRTESNMEIRLTSTVRAPTVDTVIFSTVIYLQLRTTDLIPKNLPPIKKPAI